MTETLRSQDIMALIPHRYPMLLVDRVQDINPGTSCTGVKNVTFNEPFFQGHFPGEPIMPGVLIVEAMAQTAGALVCHSMGMGAASQSHSKSVYFLGIDDARFRRPVTPGDTLLLKVEKVQNRGNVWKFKGQAFVGDALHAEATFTAMIVERTSSPS